MNGTQYYYTLHLICRRRGGKALDVILNAFGLLSGRCGRRRDDVQKMPPNSFVLRPRGIVPVPLLHHALVNRRIQRVSYAATEQLTQSARLGDVTP